MALQVRERPPLRLCIDAQAPSGSHTRWGQDEPKAANVPSDLTFTTSMPGGFESLNCTLPRKPELAYSDLERFTNLRVLGPGGAVAWEGRLESSPRVSGESMSVAPGAVGWQAHLEDDTSAREIFVDRDLSAWSVDPSASRHLSLLASGIGVESASVLTDQSSGAPSLALTNTAPWTATNFAYCEPYYDANGISLGSIFYLWSKSANTSAGPSSVTWHVGLADNDNLLSPNDETSDLQAAGPSSGTLTATTGNRKFAYLQFFDTGANSNDGAVYALYFSTLKIYGNHGLTKRGSEPDAGFYASDVIAHAVRNWAPLLTLSTGSSGTVTDSSFVIPQLAFKDPTTAADIIQGANRYHLRDWAVWEDKTFYYHDRGARGRNWRARVGPAQLSETGPSIENLWNGVIVKYQDVDGTTKTVGPTGSGCDTTSTDCEDSDPLNPANELGINRWTQIDMGGVSTAAGATEVGRRFLIEAAQYNASGQAQLVGHVEDDRGVLHPAWRVRAGDTITFVDAADTSARRVVKSSYNHSTRTCSVDLDAPPDGLDALLARLQVVLVPLGIG